MPATPSVGPAPAPTSIAPRPSDAPQSRLRMALDRDPATLDPAEVRDEAGRYVVDALYDSLTEMPPDVAGARPSAALNWTVGPDDLEWTFLLRTGGRWHDGTPVVAEDFVRAFRHLAEAEAPPFNRNLVEPLLDDAGAIDVSADDETTLVIRLPAPFADLPALVSDPALAPRRESTPDPERPIGNGPFRMGEAWAHNQFIRLAPAVGHHSAATIDEVLLPIYAQLGSEQVQYEDFRAGALDVASVPVDEVEPAQVLYGRSPDGHAGPGVVDGARASLTYLGFDTSEPPFDDPDVRRAVSLLIDRDVLVAQVGSQGRVAADGIVSPGIAGAGEATCDHCRRDLVEALGLLDAAETPLRDSIVLIAPDDPASTRVAESIVTALRGALDVAVALRSQPLDRYAEALAEGQFDLFLGGWAATRPTMGGFLDPMLDATASPLDNPGRIDDEEVQVPLAAARTAVTSNGRRAAWEEAEQAALDLAVVAPLYHPLLRTVVSDDVTGFVLAPGPRVDLAAVSVPEE